MVRVISIWGSSIVCVISARGVPQCRPESSSPYDCQEKLPDSLSRAQPARNDSSEQDLENDHGRPIVQQTLALNNDGKPLIHSEVFEDGEDGNRIGCRDDRPEQQRYQNRYACEARHFLPLDILGHPHHRDGWPRGGFFIGMRLENQPYRSTAPIRQNSSFTCTAIMRGLLSPPKPTPSKPVGGDVV